MMRELLEMVTDSNDYATNNWLSDCLQSLEKYLWKIAATLGDTEVTEPVELESTESNVIEYIEVGV
jgi:hypothetical protein